MSIRDYRLLYWTIIGVTALFVASPFLSNILVYPRTEFFTEFWILDADHKTENYPYNVSRGENYAIHLGIANHLGHCAYYMIQVKFRNQMQPAPISFGPIEDRLPSSMPSLFNFTVFVADGQIYEVSITFSFNYTWDKQLSEVKFSGLTLNNIWLNMSGYLASWDSERKAFCGFLFFEIWLYNVSVNDFQYHGRFVGLWLNMTAPRNL
ncbi:MAG: DUF1616 domain-containing protein [Candidatus Bathyarchaeia archaeon]